MNLESYLSELLYNFDCVIIPNFGGLICNYESASIHPTQHIFHPPQKSIAFNKNLSISDGLLVNYVAQSTNFSFEEATQKINTVVNDWIQLLNTGNKIELKSIGKFHFDKQGNLQFEPSRTVNYLSQSFGLNSFHTAPLKLAKEPINIPEKLKEHRKEIAEIKISKPINWKRVVAVSIAVPVIAALFWLPMKTDYLKNANISYSNINPFANSSDAAKYSERIPVEVAEINTKNTEAVDVYLNSLKVNVVATGEAVAASENINSTPVTNEVVSNSESAFHIIAGCFANRENAETLLNELKAKGYDAYIQGTNSQGLTRVSCGKFNSHSDAVTAKNNLKSIGYDAWILNN